MKLHDGTVIVDRFKEKNDRRCILMSRSIPWTKVKNFVVYREGR